MLKVTTSFSIRKKGYPRKTYVINSSVEEFKSVCMKEFPNCDTIDGGIVVHLNDGFNFVIHWEEEFFSCMSADDFCKAIHAGLLPFMPAN